MKGLARSLIVLIGLLASLVITTQAHADQAFYTLDQSARQGMLVSLSKNPDTVVPASQQNASSLVGAIGPGNDNFDLQAGQVNVRTDGITDVLITTVDGNVQIGDRIGPSSIVGFGAKQTGSGWIAGVAQGSLSPSTHGAIKTTVTDSSGHKRDVYAASIPVLIKVTYFTAPASSTQTSAIPKSLQSLADSIAGKHASVIAVLIGAFLLLTGFAIAALITQASVRSGLRAISRQPLAKPHIVKQMTRSFAMALGVLIAAILGTLIIIRVL